MARTIDDLYDRLVAIDKKLDVHLAVHAERERTGMRRWQVWLVVVAAFAAVPMSVVALIVK